jgi:hypothetical protein
MRRRLIVVILTVSAVGGVAAGVAVHEVTQDGGDETTSSSGSPVRATPTPSARTSAGLPAAETPGVEVEDSVLVSNTDGTATLSATLVNRTASTVLVDNEFGADETDPVALLIYDSNREVELEPGVPFRTGRTEDGYWIRTAERVNVGGTYRIGLEFSGEGLVKVGAPPLTIDVPVVERSSAYDDIVNNGPNTRITVTGGVVVVVPGQEKAYIGGRISNPINDGVYSAKPTAVDSRGRAVAWLHQTATGGPGGLALSEPPYLDDGTSKDADYFLAKDVTVGDTITATIQYPSGDVIGQFRVVQGRADGTIQAQ